MFSHLTVKTLIIERANPTVLLMPLLELCRFPHPGRRIGPIVSFTATQKHDGEGGGQTIDSTCSNQAARAQRYPARGTSSESPGLQCLPVCNQGCCQVGRPPPCQTDRQRRPGRGGHNPSKLLLSGGELSAALSGRSNPRLGASGAHRAASFYARIQSWPVGCPT